MTAQTPESIADDRAFGLVSRRTLAEDRPLARFAIAPGDRVLVALGDLVTPGVGLVERQRDPRVEDGPPLTAADPARPLRAGDWWPGDGHETGGPLRRRQPRTAAGELLHAADGRWRIAGGGHLDLLESPVAGRVEAVVPGREVVLALTGRAVPGAFAAGIPARGRLELVDGEAGLRGALDVGRAGTILLVDGRVDSEAIIRARAMGVRGVVASGLSGKDLRDLLGSEARQRASLQPLAPFAVLVLDGTNRRPIAGPVAALLATQEGREVAIVLDPPSLVFDPVGAPPPPDWPAGWVRLRGGDLTGREGRWIRSAGIRRFAAGVHLEAAAIALDDGEIAVVPLADLERFD